AHFAYSPNPVLMFNPEVHFTNLSSNATNYQWTFEEGNPLQSTLTNPTVQFPDGVVGTYEVVLIATSQLGCADTTELNVIVSPEILIYVPNSFTPDDDEHNQNWLVYMDGIDIYDYELLVFNRWGELVWENHDISIGWDGTFNGQNVQTGMYTWIIHTKDLLNDERYTFNGHVNVMR
ncbi:MAG: gliding motility-associated-like protein, partial [Crocinitomicaceae bacterium]